VRLQPSCDRDQQVQQTTLAALSSAASSSSGTTFTVVRVASESRPTTQMQFADRIVESLQEISDPHLLVSCLEALKARMMQVKQARDANSNAADKRSS
jgi:hypothetical protein